MLQDFIDDMGDAVPQCLQNLFIVVNVQRTKLPVTRNIQRTLNKTFSNNVSPNSQQELKDLKRTIVLPTLHVK